MWGGPCCAMRPRAVRLPGRLSGFRGTVLPCHECVAPAAGVSSAALGTCRHMNFICGADPMAEPAVRGPEVRRLLAKILSVCSRAAKGLPCRTPLAACSHRSQPKPHALRLSIAVGCCTWQAALARHHCSPCVRDHCLNASRWCVKLLHSCHVVRSLAQRMNTVALGGTENPPCQRCCRQTCCEGIMSAACRLLPAMCLCPALP